MKLTTKEIQEARNYVIDLREGYPTFDNCRLCNIIIQALDERLNITNQDILQDYIKVGNELDRVQTKIKFVKEDILGMLEFLNTPNINSFVGEKRASGAIFAYKDCLSKIEDIIGDKSND